MRVRGRAAARALAVGLAALVSCDQGMNQRPRGIVAVGQPVPAYTSARLDGTPVSLADHRDKVVLLNIWATWCKPCREEIPALEALHAAYAERGLMVAGVSIDVHNDTASIAGFARSLGATYTLWHDPDDRVSTLFLSVGVPNTYLIGRDGLLKWRHVGPVRADDATLRAALDSALSQRAAPEASP